MSTKSQRHIKELALDKHIETLKNGLSAYLRCAVNLLKSFDCFGSVTKLTVHLESQEVDFKLIFLSFMDHLAALFDSFASLGIITKFKPSIGRDQAEFLH